MNFRGKILIALISVVIAGYAIIGGYFSRAQQPINDVGAQIRIFESVLQHIQNDYVDPPNMENVRAGALRGLANGLDPYSSYLTAEQVRTFDSDKADERAGIGAEFSQVSSYLYVISVVKNSPADVSGVRAGDVIEYIGDRASRDISLYDAQQLVRGAAGTTLRLRVLRTGEKPQWITVTRGSFEAPPPKVEMKDGDTAVISVYSLDETSIAKLRNEFEELNSKKISKAIVDLRGTAGGTFDDGVRAANLFVGEGVLAKVIGNDEIVTRSFEAKPANQVYSGKLAVLIDLGTAGAAEIVAAAVSESKRGEVIGERSFGAGTEQKLFPLSGGDGFLLTTAKWSSPSGTPFLGEKRSESGVEPTIEVKRPETPEPIEVEELVDQQEESLEEPVEPEVEVPERAEEPADKDIQLERALEVMRNG